MSKNRLSGNIDIDIVLKGGPKEGYTAECLDLEVVSEGDTKEEALKNIEEAIELHLEVAVADGIADQLLSRIRQKTKPEIREIHVAMPLTA